MRRLRISWLAREFRLDRQYLRQKTCARFSRIKAWRRPAPEIEALVLDGVRQQIASSKAEPALTDRELIERHVERVTIKSQAVEVYFVAPGGVAAVSSNAMAHAVQPPAKITLSWAAPGFAAVKGIVQAPSTKSTIKPESRDALLTAIAKARAWIDDIRLGHLASFLAGAHRRDISHAEQLCGLDPAVASNDAVGAIDQDRIDKAKFLDTGRDLPYLLRRVGARIEVTRPKLGWILIGYSEG
jgi:hypothetical protein